ncbi:serine/arginine-rich splicing factor 3-like isoform X1 [Gordionus sp. m RMFG-2023]|uniref:serine/arginine-rich splicing factor 3-like isoform X1 n=1 Tax=Gordionus sp. m RMFG-2023 TaxID=3053472 RepID=UPI0031FC237A
MSYMKNCPLDCKVYVGDLGNGVPSHELEAAFSKYGRLKNVWVARNPPGFAFVEFEDPRDADDAVRALDGTKICGVRVRVELSHGKSKSKDSGGRRNNNNSRYDDDRDRRRNRRYSRSNSRGRSRSYSRGRGKYD